MPKKPAKIYHFDSFGKRQEKYDRLNESSFSTVDWKELEYKEPYYFFVPKDFAAEEIYNQGFSIEDIFNERSSWIHTGKDHLVIDIDKNILVSRIQEVLNWEDLIIREKYDLKDTSWWTLERFKSTENDIENYVKVKFRPFDDRWILYENKALKRDRYNIMKHIFKKNNLWLVTIRRSRSNNEWNYITVSDILTTEPTTITSLDNNYFFPLYLYNLDSQEILDTQNSLIDSATRAEWQGKKTPNFDMEVIEQIEKKLGMKLMVRDEDTHSEKNENTKQNDDTQNDNNRSLQGDVFTPENLLDYIYAVLHSQSYRDTYKEFLKIDFPKIPFDVDTQTFFALAKLGAELRSWHLLEHEALTPQNFLTSYPVEWDNWVDKIHYSIDPATRAGWHSSSEWDIGKVYINETQYFDGVPENVWEFYIGGYQPAQKWLKDRKGRNLAYEDIVHYGKIILTLSETIRIMQEIDTVFTV